MKPNSSLFLMKLGEKQYMQKLFERGEIFMNNTFYYQNHPNKEIRDEEEGLIHSRNFGPDDLLLSIGGRNIPYVEARETTYNKFNHYIYCMWHFSSMHVPNHNNLEHIIDLSQYKSFGADTCVIINHQKFIKRLTDKLQETGKKFAHHQIEYYDEKTHNGDVSPFMKRNQYKHQQEYRFIVEEGTEPTFSLNIGSLEDIACIYTLNSFLKLKLYLANQ